MKTEREFITTRQIFVTVDESKFTPKFMEEYRQYFFPWQTVDDHREHLAELFAIGVLSGWPSEFIEGYGPAVDMGISFREGFTETEAIKRPALTGETGGAL